MVCLIDSLVSLECLRPCEYITGSQYSLAGLEFAVWTRKSSDLWQPSLVLQGYRHEPLRPAGNNLVR